MLEFVFFEQKCIERSFLRLMIPWLRCHVKNYSASSMQMANSTSKTIDHFCDPLGDTIAVWDLICSWTLSEKNEPNTNWLNGISVWLMMCSFLGL